MAPDVASHLAAAGGVTDMDHVLEIEMSNKFGEVVRISIEIVPVPRLARPSVAAAVVRNTAIAA